MAPLNLFRRWRSEEGAQLVEFALVLPLLLFVVLGIAEFGFIFQRYEVITNAAREGARLAVLPGYSTAAAEDAIRTRVRNYIQAARVPITAGTPPASIVTVNLANDTVAVGGGLPAVSIKRCTVTYTHRYTFLPSMASWFGFTYTTVPLTAVSEMRVEGGT
jgi:Flp pilus assembly protein TadG